MKWTAALFSVLAIPGCGADSAMVAPVERVVSASQAVLQGDVCPGTRWIGQVGPNEMCPTPPDPGRFDVDFLFYPGAANPVPGELGTYCLYTWNDASTPNAAYLPYHGILAPDEWLDPDCRAVVATANADLAAAALAPNLQSAFLRQIEEPDEPLPPGHHPVEVGVVDSWPQQAVLGRLDHGKGMASIIRRLACGDNGGAPCDVTPVPRLALDRIYSDASEPVIGGWYGYVGTLATAIFGAFEGRGQGKLVLNLSVGWDDRYGTSTAPARAVRAALEHAACGGALIIAAAGNAGNGTAPGSGPLYPAAWEMADNATCPGPNARFIHAVSGVTGSDATLPNARPGARARLAAPALAVPGIDDSIAPREVTGPFTGSSVAAAVASGVAAAVWTRDPGLTAHQVMERLRDTAVPTSEDADFCPSALESCGKVGRISLGRAMEQTLGHPVDCHQHGAGAGADTTWSASDISAVRALETSVFDARSLTQVFQPPQCSKPLFIPELAASYVGPSACPAEEWDNELVRGAVGPQPPIDPCPDCYFHLADWWLELVINARVNTTVYPLVLSLRNGRLQGSRYDLGSATSNGIPLREGLAPNGVYRVLLPPIREAFDGASIEWKMAPDLSETSTLVLGK